MGFDWGSFGNPRSHLKKRCLFGQFLVMWCFCMFLHVLNVYKPTHHVHSWSFSNPSYAWYACLVLFFKRCRSVYVHTCIHKYVCTMYIRMYVRVCIRTYIHTCICMYMYMYMCAYMCTYVHAYVCAEHKPWWIGLLFFCSNLLFIFLAIFMFF